MIIPCKEVRPNEGFNSTVRVSVILRFVNTDRACDHRLLHTFLQSSSLFDQTSAVNKSLQLPLFGDMLEKCVRREKECRVVLRPAGSHHR